MMFQAKNIIITTGRGIGQVMFQNNALSGFLMLIAIFLNSWQMGLLAISGNIASTMTAYFLGYNREDIRNGLYGFNGTLVGISTGVFMQFSYFSFLLMIILACISTWITRLFNRQHLLPGLTAPFILVIWILIIFCNYCTPQLLLTSNTTDTSIDSTIHYWQCFSLGIGQVMFQTHILSGLFFLTGILIQSPTSAGYTLLGALLPIPMAWLLNLDPTICNMGLLGYNGVLCAISLGKNSLLSLLSALIAILLSMALQILGMKTEITTLTAPFVISVWILIILQKIWLKKTSNDM